jgi:serine/threonine protein kinase
LTHKVIIQRHKVIPDGELLFVITESSPEGDLLSWVIARPVCDRLLQSTIAVQYRHRQGIAHSDITPKNVMIHNAGKATLIDFGDATDRVIGDDGTKCAASWALSDAVSQCVIIRHFVARDGREKFANLRFPDSADVDAKEFI